MTKATITASKLKSIRESWGMSQSAFSGLLAVPIKTYQGWEQGRPVPAQVAQHIATIGKMRLLYKKWDKVAESIIHIGGTALTGESRTVAINEADYLADRLERLWGRLFPELNRE